MNLEIRAPFALHAKQREFVASPSRFAVASAGVRGGKTSGAALKFLARIYRDLEAGRCNTPTGSRVAERRARWHGWIVGPTFYHLGEAFRCLFDVLPDELVIRYSPAAHTLRLAGDVLIEGKSAERPEKLVSVGLNGMWVTEAARVKNDTWPSSLRSRLSDRQGWAIFDTSPFGGPGNWVFEYLIANARDHVDEFSCTEWAAGDNPVYTAEELESAKSGLPKRYWLRDYCASWDSFTGNVFDEWDDSIHVVSESALRAEFNVAGPLRSIFRRIIAGVDWGWNSPGAIVVVGDTGREQIVLEESYAANRIVFDGRLSDTWVEEAKRLRAKWGITQFFCDPARPDAIFDFQRCSLPATGADNEIVYGIRKLAEQLHPVAGKPRLRVLDCCTNLIREMRGYQWAQGKGTDFAELPAPNQSDHAVDALRYAEADVARYLSQNPVAMSPQNVRPFAAAGRPIG